MSPESPKLEWTPKEVMDLFGPKLTKDILSLWTAKGLRGEAQKPGTQTPRRRSKGGKRPKSSTQKFSPEDVFNLAVLLDERGPLDQAQAILEEHRIAKDEAPGIASTLLRSPSSILNALLAKPGHDSKAGIPEPLSDVLRDLMLYAKRLLQVEHCAVFLPEDSAQNWPTDDSGHPREPDLLKIVADSREAPDVTHSGQSLRKDRGWTWRAFISDEIVNRFGADLADDRTGHLRGRRTSVLVMPLRYRSTSSKPAAILKIENKSASRSGYPRPFDADDTLKAALIGMNVMLLLEMSAMMQGTAEVIQRLHDRTSFRAVAKTALEHTRRLTMATSADLLREHKEATSRDLQLSVEASVGEKPRSIGGVLMEPNIWAAVLRESKEKPMYDGAFEPNVRSARGYKDCREDSFRDYAMPVRIDERSFAVINLESKETGGLDAYDAPVISYFAKLIGLGGQNAGYRDILAHRDGFDGQPALQSELEKFFKPVLNKAITGNRYFHHGIAYHVDYRTGWIREVGCANCVKKRDEPFSMQFDGDSPKQFAAARVVRDGVPYFSRYPKEDSNIHQDGLDQFGIQGSLLAVAVRLPTALLPVVAGVLVLWTGGPFLHEDEVGPLKKELEDAVRLTIVAS